MVKEIGTKESFPGANQLQAMPSEVVRLLEAGQAFATYVGADSLIVRGVETRAASNRQYQERLFAASPTRDDVERLLEIETGFVDVQDRAWYTIPRAAVA